MERTGSCFHPEFTNGMLRFSPDDTDDRRRSTVMPALLKFRLHLFQHEDTLGVEVSGQLVRGNHVID